MRLSAISIRPIADGSAPIRRRRDSRRSHLDLVVLVDDPADIATMLVRLTDDEVSGPDVQSRQR